MTSPALYDALRTENHTSAADWVAQFPTASIVELARRLPGGIAPITLQQELVKEARERGAFPQVARGLLVRLLNSAFPRGVGAVSADEAASNLSSAFGMWLGSFDADQQGTAEAIWTKVVATLDADPEWVPQHSEDARFLACFAGFNLERTPRAKLVADARLRIEARFGTRTGIRERIAALSDLPPGYGFLHAGMWVDTAVRNGGFAQLFAQSGGVEVPLAIAGLRCVQAEELANLIEESLAFARTYHREKLAPGLFDAPVIAAFPTPRTWSALDKVYFAQPADLFERFATLLEERPELFEPPFRQLRNKEDGRLWKVRTSGTLVEIQIGLDDGTSITRERRCATAAKAEQEAQALIAEQLAEGFVEA